MPPPPAGVKAELDLGAHGQPFTPLGVGLSSRSGLRRGSLPTQILRPNTELQQLGTHAVLRRTSIRIALPSRGIAAPSPESPFLGQDRSSFQKDRRFWARSAAFG